MQVLQNTQLSFSLKLMGKVKSVTDFMPQGRFTQCRNLFLNNWIPHVTLELYKFFKIYTYILQSKFTFIQSTYLLARELKISCKMAKRLLKDNISANL